jgi:hypothetical protein
MGMKWNETAAMIRQTDMPKMVTSRIRRRPNLSTMTRLTMLKMKFVAETVMATAVALLNPTILKRVAE